MNIGDKIEFNKKEYVVIKIRESGITKHDQVEIVSTSDNEKFWINVKGLRPEGGLELCQ